MRSQELAALMKSDKVVGRDYCIVDVRDDDWYGGNIKGSRNSPSHGFLSKVDELVAQTKDVPTVIFHCALSQVRYVDLNEDVFDAMLMTSPGVPRLLECAQILNSFTPPVI